MAVDDLARADPLPRIISWLANHPTVTTVLGGAGRVGMFNEPPFPRVRLLDVAGGSDRDLRWLIATNVQLEVYGDLSGAPGKAALRHALYVVMGALAQLPDQTVPAGGPIITAVNSSIAAAWAPEPSGQPRYVTSLLIWSHPAPA